VGVLGEGATRNPRLVVYHHMKYARKRLAVRARGVESGDLFWKKQEKSAPGGRIRTLLGGIKVTQVRRIGALWPPKKREKARPSINIEKRKVCH